MGESINEALNKLTPRERTVFELKHYQGLKLRTIGEMLNTTEETAKNTLFRATRKLRAHLAELEGAQGVAANWIAARIGKVDATPNGQAVETRRTVEIPKPIGQPLAKSEAAKGGQ